jgi:probable phosphomutase (TIGR03848 family)
VLAITIEPGALVGVRDVLDGERVQIERRLQLLELGGRRRVHSHPAEVTRTGRRPQRGEIRTLQGTFHPTSVAVDGTVHDHAAETRPPRLATMATVILVRHGRTTANTSGLLAGRTRGVALDDLGREQASAAGKRLRDVPLAALVTSPLERCRQTAKAIAAAQSPQPSTVIDRALNECDYGDWAGQPLKSLVKEKLWRVVQDHPSAAVFPGGESMRAMQDRAVTAVRMRDAELPPEATWAAVSHGDVIKSILADALGMHLDLFQRLHVDPASISIVSYHDSRPRVLAINSTAGDLGWLRPPKRKRRRTSDAAVGGGAGPGNAD